ncbi:MAG: ribonuclease Z [Bacteroidaceae bacterium]|nr:ribonuclease Z [Bacteroidaceae bacterium]
MQVTILGCGSANPTQRHQPASQVLEMRGKLFMVDCGEGTQMRLAHSGLAMNRIGHIFITHAHGDHCFGLPGLISTMGLLGRTAQIHIHAPQELENYLQQTLDTFCHDRTHEVLFHAVDTQQHARVYEDRSVEVWALPLNHRTPCCGYLFREKQGPRHLRRDICDMYEIPICYFDAIKAGADWTQSDGTVIPNNRLTTDPTPVCSWAYVSDTRYKPQVAEWVRGVDLLFHEATFPADDLLRARQTYHSTSEEAARIAQAAQVGQLCIGHFSARIRDEKALLEQAQAIFPRTILADEGLQIDIAK